MANQSASHPASLPVSHPASHPASLSVLDHIYMRVHIGKVAAIRFFFIYVVFANFDFFLASSSMQRHVSVVIISRIDYCNAMLYGLPAITLALHAAVRVAANLGCRDHKTPAMKEHHWLPIAYRMQIMSHDERGSKQQQPGIYYRYRPTRSDIISASP